MPLYEYKCAKCGHRFEKIESVSAPETQKCSRCGSKAERMASAPAIQFKGSGWYVTDYGGKSSSASGNDGAAEGATAASKSDGKAAGEPKPAAEKSAAAPGDKGATKKKK